MDSLSPLLKSLETAHIKPLSELAKRKSTTFTITPSVDELAEIVQLLGISGLRKLTFKGELTPIAKQDWRLKAHLGASVIQECVLTLAPVTTRLEEPVNRHFSKDFIITPEDADTEIEMPEDDNLEPLDREINLLSVLLESLSLALPPYPRKDSASFDNYVHTEPGQSPMRDEDARPFAALSQLKDALKKPSQE